MCFSPEASFAASAGLVPAGIYCVQAAIRKRIKLLLLAVVPIVFGIQQFVEGWVWIGLENDNPTLVEYGSSAFLFFALAFWPFWIPFCLTFVETRPLQKSILYLFSATGLVWLWVAWPAITTPGHYVDTRVVHHSILYENTSLPAFSLMPQVIWRILYLANVCIPLAIGPIGLDSKGNKPHPWGGIVVAALFGLSYLIYFFAALFSGLLCIEFFRLSRDKSEQPAQVETVSS